MLNRKLNLLFLALLVSWTTLISMPAKANITLTPTLVVIEGRQRFADLYVLNTTNERQTYELETKFLKMVEDKGNYTDSDKSLTDFDLTQNVVFTPRRIIIGPKDVQKVRVALRLKGAPPAPGDYRFHLSLLNKADRSAEAQETLGKGQAAVSVGMNVAFSIPVVYRVGDINGGGGKIGKVTTQINQKTKKIEVVVPITRTPGPYSALGELLINYNGQKVGQIANANIFTEISGRTFKIPLDIQSLAGGNLEIIYRDFNKEKKRVFDTKVVNIAK